MSNTPYQNGFSPIDVEAKPPELRETVPYQYANTVQCSIMELDIRIAFGDRGPGASAKGTAGIILHPVLAKRLLTALTTLLQTYEEVVGPIIDLSIPKEQK